MSWATHGLFPLLARRVPLVGRRAPLQELHLGFGALCLSLLSLQAEPLTDSLFEMNRNARKAKKANHGARPCSHRGRKAKAHRKGVPTASGRQGRRWQRER